VSLAMAGPLLLTLLVRQPGTSLRLLLAMAASLLLLLLVGQLGAGLGVLLAIAICCC
jgi:hypothetical protein